MKTEKIMIVLYTDKDGRKLTGGANIDDDGRDWKDIFADAAEATKKNGGQVIDLKL